MAHNPLDEAEKKYGVRPLDYKVIDGKTVYKFDQNNLPKKFTEADGNMMRRIGALEKIGERENVRTMTGNSVIDSIHNNSFIQGAAKNYFQYGASINKALSKITPDSWGFKEGQQYWDREAKMADANMESAGWGLAGEIVSDPINLLPAGIFTKAGKAETAAIKAAGGLANQSRFAKHGTALNTLAVKAPRIAKSIAGGAAVGAGTMALKNYGDDSMTLKQKSDEIIMGAIGGGILNGLIAPFTKATSLYDPSAQNSILSRLFNRGAQPAASATGAIQQSDQQIAQGIMDNLEAFGMKPQQGAAQPQQPMGFQGTRVEQAGRQPQPNYTPNFTMVGQQAQLPERPQWYGHPRLNELLSMRENALAYQAQSPQSLVAPRMPINQGGRNERWIGATYDENPMYDFTLTKQDVDNIRAGRITPDIQRKIETDLSRLDSDPKYAPQPEQNGVTYNKDGDFFVDSDGNPLGADGMPLFANGGGGLGGAMGGATLGGSTAAYEDIVEGKNLSAEDYATRMALGAAGGFALSKTGLMRNEEAAGGQKLGLFAGERARNFQKAQADGNVHYGKYDDMARFEIDDSAAKLKPINRLTKEQASLQASDEFARIETSLKHGEISKEQADYLKEQAYANYKFHEQRTFTLNDVLDHPELFDNYPQFKDTKVEFIDDADGTRGYYDPETNTIGIHAGASEKEILSTLLHETQHGVQGIEGFARGGNMDEAYRELDRRIYDLEQEGFLDDHLAEKYASEIEKLRTSRGTEAFKLYERIAGEIEAREVQARQYLTPDERKIIEPYNNGKTYSDAMYKQAEAIQSYENAQEWIDYKAGRVKFEDLNFNDMAELNGYPRLNQAQYEAKMRLNESKDPVYQLNYDQLQSKIDIEKATMNGNYERSRVAYNARDEGRLTNQNSAGIDPNDTIVRYDNARSQLFAGENAKDADKNALAAAKAMTAKGIDREQIWKDTGWFLDRDGKWKFEIDDSGATLNDKIANGEVKDWTNPYVTIRAVGDAGDSVVQHEELLRQYPDTGRIKSSGKIHNEIDDIMSAMLGNTPEKIGGSYHPSLDRITTNVSIGSTKSTTLHELQHAIQQREGFAAGGSPEQFQEYMRAYNEARHKLERMDSVLGFNKFFADNAKKYDLRLPNGRVNKDALKQMRSDFEKTLNISQQRSYRSAIKQKKAIEELLPSGFFADDSTELYRRLHGEAEARNVQTRMNMTAEERRATPPWKTLDVSENDTIVKFDNGTMMSVNSDAPYEKKIEDIRSFFKSKVDRAKLNAEEKELYDFAMTNQSSAQFINDGVRTLLNKGDDNAGFKHILIRHYGDGADSELSPWDVLRIGKTIKEGSPLTDAELSKNIEQLGYSKNAIRRLVDTPNGKFMYVVGVGRDETGGNAVITYYKTKIDSGMTYADDYPKAPVAYNSKVAGGYSDRISHSVTDESMNQTPLKENEEVLSINSSMRGGFIANPDLSKKAKEIADSDITDFFTGHKVYGHNDYMKAREDMIMSQNGFGEEMTELSKMIDEFTPETREKIHNEFVGDTLENSGYVSDFVSTMRAKTDSMMQEIKGLGVLPDDVIDDYMGVYSHRTYKDKMANDVSNFGESKTLPKIHSRGLSIKTEDAEEVYKFLSDYADKKGLPRLSYLNANIDDVIEEATQKGYFGSKANGFAKYRKIGNSYVFERDYTHAERTAMGENRDASYTIPDTFVRLNQLSTAGKFLKQVSEMTDLVMHKAEVDELGEEYAKSKGYIQLNGKKYGMLNGQWVKSEIANDISNMMFDIHGADGAGAQVRDGIVRGVRWIKKTHTVYNPKVHVNNIVSNAPLLVGAGVNPLKVPKLMSDAALPIMRYDELQTLSAKAKAGTATPEQIVRLAAFKKDKDLMLYEQAKKAGAFGRSSINDVMQGKARDIAGLGDTTQGRFSKIDDTLSDIYAKEDDVARFALIKYAVSKGKTLNEAIKIANSNIADYTKPMSKAAHFASRYGVIPFISWTYYTLPIMLRQLNPVDLKGGVKLAKDDFGNARIKNSLILLGLTTAPFAAGHLATGTSPDDLPDDNVFMHEVPVSKNGNKVTTVKTDKWNPYYMMASPVETVKNLATSSPFMSIGMATRNIDSYWGGKVTYNEGARKNADIGIKIASEFTPDIIDQTVATGRSLLQDKEARRTHKEKDPRTTWQEFMNFIINSRTYNADKVRQRRINESIKR